MCGTVKVRIDGLLFMRNLCDKMMLLKWLNVAEVLIKEKFRFFKLISHDYNFYT